MNKEAGKRIVVLTMGMAIFVLFQSILGRDWYWWFLFAGFNFGWLVWLIKDESGE